MFGSFNSIEVQAIVDGQGNHWFTQTMAAEALGIDKSTISRMRQNHAIEFTKFEDFMTMTLHGSRQGVFLRLCDLSSSKRAFQLRRWMRKQFRARRNPDGIMIQAKGMPEDDLSDLSPEMLVIHKMVNEMVQNQLAIKRNERHLELLRDHQERIKEENEQLRNVTADHEVRIKACEEGAHLKPGELTAIQLADQCGWRTKSGGPHNLAVILAAINAGFEERRLMLQRREEAPANCPHPVFVHVFTTKGVAAFISEIDSQFNSGDTFTISPGSRAQTLGQKNRRHVIKA